MECSSPWINTETEPTPSHSCRAGAPRSSQLILKRKIMRKVWRILEMLLSQRWALMKGPFAPLKQSACLLSSSLYLTGLWWFAVVDGVTFLPPNSPLSACVEIKLTSLPKAEIKKWKWVTEAAIRSELHSEWSLKMCVWYRSGCVVQVRG